MPECVIEKKITAGEKNLSVEPKKKNSTLYLENSLSLDFKIYSKLDDVC